MVSEEPTMVTDSNYSKFASHCSETNLLDKMAKNRGLGKSFLRKLLALWYSFMSSDGPVWARAVIIGALGYFIMSGGRHAGFHSRSRLRERRRSHPHGPDNHLHACYRRHGTEGKTDCRQSHVVKETVGYKHLPTSVPPANPQTPRIIRRKVQMAETINYANYQNAP